MLLIQPQASCELFNFSTGKKVTMGCNLKERTPRSESHTKSVPYTLVHVYGRANMNELLYWDATSA